MNDYVIYSFYDEVGKTVAIIDIRTPKELIIELEKKYDEVKYEE